MYREFAEYGQLLLQSAEINLQEQTFTSTLQTLQ